MTQEKIAHMELLLERVKKSLINNFFTVEIVDSKEDALNYLKNAISPKDTIGYGGSRTLEEIGFFKTFTKNNYPNLLDRSASEITPEEKTALQKRALTADIFLASVNGLSITGDLVFIDKWGNRNGGATYGPRKRIFVVGWNKLAENLQEALNRAQNIASVENNIRFATGNPCTQLGKCVDCHTENRICCVTTIISRCQPVGSAVVLLVKEALGF